MSIAEQLKEERMDLAYRISILENDLEENSLDDDSFVYLNNQIDFYTLLLKKIDLALKNIREK